VLSEKALPSRFISLIEQNSTIKPANKHCNDVILSDAKNLAFSCCYEILHSVQDDNYNCRVNSLKNCIKTFSLFLLYNLKTPVMRNKMKLAYLFFCIAVFLFSVNNPALSPLLALNNNAFAAGQGYETYQQENMVHLTWKNAGAGFMYQFQMARDKEFRQILIDEKCNKPEITFPEPAASGAYYIRLRPIGPDGQAGAFSPAQRYEINTKLDPPVILSPEEIAEYRDIYDVRVSWSGVPHGSVYHVVLARDRMFHHVIYDNPKAENTALTLWNLDYGTYFLKVSAISKDGAEGPFSGAVSFIVVPPVPMITASE
jgi:hypothetical protein